MSSLRERTIRLAYARPDLQASLLPLLASSAREGMEFQTQDAMGKYLKEHPGADKSNHSVAKPKKDEGKKDAPKKDEGKHESIVHKALHHAGHALTAPFKAAWKVITKPEARTNLKNSIVKAVKDEVAETKHLGKTIRDALSGKAVKPADKVKAMNQVADFAKAAMISYTVKHMAAHGIVKLLASMASPVDEVVGIALDAPLRKITKKVFGQEHGILPSAFYGLSTEPDPDVGEVMWQPARAAADAKKPTVDDVLKKLMDSIMDEFEKVDLSDSDIIDALVENGLDEEKAKKLAEALAGKKGD